jgi:cytochrome c-type biogenesis protein CcmH
MKFTLSQANVMVQGRPFQGNLRITARLDSDGSAGPAQPGDMEGISSGLVPVGAKNVNITVDREIGGGKTRPSVSGGGGTISGTIAVAPGLAAKAAGKPVLFIIARTERPGPPLAVVKMANPKFPMKFTLSQANVMVQGRPFQGNLRITARLDSDGSAGPGQPGDIEGASAGLVPVGSKDIVITLDKER